MMRKSLFQLSWILLLLSGFVTQATAGTGIFLRGDVNSWEASVNWEFQETGANTYELTNKTLSGSFKVADANWSVSVNYGAGAQTYITADEPYTMFGGENPGNILIESGVSITCSKIILKIISSSEAELTLVATPTTPAEPSVATSKALWPSNARLLTEMPKQVRILSLNNSLINYARQDTVFNHIAAAMGKDAIWISHSNIGKTLDYQWNEKNNTGNNVEGQPSARTMIASQPWTHIILQEQTEKPRTQYEAFHKSIKDWVTYIRENCPNPNAVIILPVNWPLRTDEAFYKAHSAQLEENYKKVAQEFGLVLAPVGEAYLSAFEKEGANGLASWFRPSEENNGMGLDDRHPSQKSTYLAACIEYATIFGENPLDITYELTNVDPAAAATMRNYAAEAVNSIEQVVDIHNKKVKMESVILDQYGKPMTVGVTDTWSLSGGGTLQNGVFTANGEEGIYTVSVDDSQFSAVSKVIVAAPGAPVALPAIVLSSNSFSENFNALGTGTALPEGWRIDRQTAAPRTLGIFAMASDEAMHAQTADNIKLPSNAKNGTWNFGDAIDRALGGLTTGVANATRCVNVYAHFVNESARDLTSLTLAYNVKKFRKGSNPAGFIVQLYYSIDGMSWTKASDFFSYFAPDAATEGYDTLPGEIVSVSAALPVNLPLHGNLYLDWNISVATGDVCNAAMALGVDDVVLSGIATGIANVTSSAVHPSSKAIYNIAGQRVSSAYKGIVIQNGKKIMKM